MTSKRSFLAVSGALAPVLGARPRPESVVRVHGGCINECYRWESDKGALFIKIAQADRLSMFEAEAAGLKELSGAHAVRVPNVLAVGATESNAYLALEWIDLTAASPAAETQLGERLARQHGLIAPAFGWHRDNTIGRTLQNNTQSTKWVDFFRECRLRYQLNLARRNGYEGSLQQRGAQLLECMDAFFTSYQPVPSLLHGDLWGGNWGTDANGAPVIFDPAVYYGDCEADIAMTRLFGGFGPRFYSAYQAVRPPDAGAPTRSTLYNLYHVLNHLNLFGAGYLGPAESMIDRLLVELKG